MEGSSPPQPGGATIRTGVRTAVAPPGAVVTRVASASTVTAGAVRAAPRTRGRTGRGSPVTVTSSVAGA
ncbi:hypothetical protein [Streptomyces luteireticuli]|uniref:hypothetical protein n=1 Tax=Streptomyces luteireticuli TaxID=173858 RepID=UPI003CD078E0